MTNFNVEEERGKIILHTGVMNGGKTIELLNIANQLNYSKYNVIAFSPLQNKRDLNYISAMGGQIKFPATVVDGNKPEIILEKVDSSKKNIDAIIIDETNFFSPSLVNVVKELRTQNRVVLVGGLDFDFRGEPYGATPLIKLIADEIEFHYPMCNMVHNDERCSKTAKNTLRLIKNKNNNQNVIFEIKKDERIETNFTYAPYYHIRDSPEDETQKDIAKRDVVYVAACRSCFKVPRKNETLTVYEYISGNRSVTTEDLHHRFHQYPDLENILDFFVCENRVFMKNGIYHVQKFVRDYSIIGNYKRIE